MIHIFVRRNIRSCFLFILLSVCLAVLLAGCPGGETEQSEGKDSDPDKEPVQLVYMDWASEKASTNVVRAVIEKRLDRECETLSVSLLAAWQAIAAGERDGMVAAWLPSLTENYLQQFQSDVVNLGPNLEGTRVGLVVPSYVTIDSIDDMGDHAGKFGNKIIGIDPHAGLMEKTSEAIEGYDLGAFELISGSGPTMTTSLESAIEDKRWIVVTGWTPHWMFARWDLKYLDDPKGVYGQKGNISTIVREGLEEDMPEVYRFLDNFHWTPEDMEEVMLRAQAEDTTYRDAAQDWVNQNKSIVDEWVK